MKDIDVKVQSYQYVFFGCIMGSSRFGDLSKKTEGVRRVYAQGNSPVFTESQMQVSERRKLEKQVEGEIETKTSRIFRTPKYV
ncbi:hypothetical protein IQA49_08170 [Leptospira borgpetersenii serovar Ballum]|nr:Integrase core domain protein [Leptospira borgpetersenii str. 4E]KGE22796.1 hypothetical protein IQ66_14655 [Leptospira borgpetersenii serovar Ballum]MBF3373622.1 hypothetical protein [Leptospira borgpetersenii serovar Arborea]MBE8160626.1 hypothetical protein [Leptospira borgpetersenii serovar Ballum]MBE8166044.1 hypothetical protein [Leptospira borgpetersenii serovar Ballum]